MGPIFQVYEWPEAGAGFDALETNVYLNSVVRFQPFRLWSYPGNLAQNSADKSVLATHFNPETNSAVSMRWGGMLVPYALAKPTD
jgi:hypothetical protein